MLSIGSFLFACSNTDKKKDDQRLNCFFATVALEAISGIALMTIAGLALTGKMTPFCSSAGSYAMIGVGAFSALPGVILVGIILGCLATEVN